MKPKDSIPVNMEKELHPELISLGSLYPYLSEASSQRIMMSMSQLPQHLIVKHPTVRKTFTHSEREYGKYTFNVKTPSTIEIIRIIDKYPQRGGVYNFQYNPLSVVIYLDKETMAYGAMTINKFHNLNKKFGFEYVRTPEADGLYPGNVLEKDTVLYRSPCLTEDGDYMIGMETNVAIMSIPQVAEDGVVVTESFCKAATSKAVGEVTFSLGHSGYPLNILGGKEHYKVIPDIGEVVSTSGLVAAIREFRDGLSVAEMTPRALRTLDSFFDKPVRVKPGARIIDITIHRQNNTLVVPDTMTGQLMRYWEAQRRFYQEILQEYHRLQRLHGEIQITNEFNDYIVFAMQYEYGTRDKVRNSYNKQPLDEWWVSLKYEYDQVPTIGSKGSGFQGDKFVIVSIIPDEDAPYDSRGHRAHLIADDKPTIKRMIVSRCYETYFNSAGVHVLEDVRLALGYRHDEILDFDHYHDHLKEEEVQMAFDTFLSFYEVIAPIQREEMMALAKQHPEYPRYCVAHALSQTCGLLADPGLRIHKPTNAPVSLPHAVIEMEARFKPLYGPVWYKGLSGNWVQTQRNVRISSQYIMILEKTGDEQSAVSSARRQHFGVPTKVSKYDRYMSLVRKSATRSMGEAEVRNYVANVGAYPTMDMLDRSTNIQVHRMECDSILWADDPMDIESTVDRTRIPMGYGRIHQFMHHNMHCDGLKFFRTWKKKENT